MKKLLLATTAFGMFAAGAALAAGPTVTIGGYADAQVGVSDQDAAYEQGIDISGSGGATDNPHDTSTHSRTDTEIHVKADGKTDNGLKYGALVELEADVNGSDEDTANTRDNSKRTFIYVETAYGRTEAGANYSANDSLRVDASNIARASGGIAGDFYRYVEFGNSSVVGSANQSTAQFFVAPGLVTDVGLPGDLQGATDTHGDTATANKLTYYTPRYYGVQGGLSYTPDADERGSALGFSSRKRAATVGSTTARDFEDVWNAALNYEGQYNQIGIQASAQGEVGNYKGSNGGVVANSRDDLEGYALGLGANYAGFSVAGSWGTVDEFGQISSQGQEINYWTLGGAYEFGPFGASVTYLDSTSEAANVLNSARVDAEFNNLVLGADYQLAPGLMPYVEVSFFDSDDNRPATIDNDGTVILVGTELNF